MMGGGGSADTNFTSKDAMQAIPGFIAGGLHARTTVDENGNPKVYMTSNQQRKDAIQGLSDKYGGLSDEYGALRSRVAPGFSEIRKARLGAVENARKRAQSTMSGNFARRRMLGSSFAADTLSRADLEAGQLEADQRAKTFLEEMGATVDLINREGAADIASSEAIINNMNFEAGLASGMAQQAQGAISNIMNTSKQLAAQEMSGGDFWTGVGGSALLSILGTAGAAFTGGTSAALAAGALGAMATAQKASQGAT